MTRLQLNKTLSALATGAALLIGSLGVASSASGESGDRVSVASTSGQTATRELGQRTRPVSPAAARANARRAAQGFFDKKGPYLPPVAGEVGTAWNERGTGECRSFGGGIKIRCAAWVGLAAELTDEEVPYRTCDWWVDTVRLQSGRVVVRDQVAKRRCETLWF